VGLLKYYPVSVIIIKIPNEEYIMPYYDLYCPACDKEINVSATMSDKKANKIGCPECGSKDLKTVFKTPPAYIKNAKLNECPNSHVCGAACRHAG